MNFIQRAIRYVRRKPTKSLLLAVTFFLIGNLVILGLGVSQAADNAKILTRKKMRAIVSYEVDFMKYWGDAEKISDEDEYKEFVKNPPRISGEIAKHFASDERVKAYNYLLTNTAYGIGVDHVPLGNDNDEPEPFTDESGNKITPSVINFMIYATGVDNMIELAEGTFNVVDGRWISQQDIDGAKPVCCITEELADVNSLHVGDTITITTINPQSRQPYYDKGHTDDDMNLELEIIGIYTTTETVDPNAENFRWMYPYESPKNRIMTTLTSTSEYWFDMQKFNAEQNPDWEFNEEQARVETSSPAKVTYLLDDPLHVDNFVSDNEGRCEKYTLLNANNETFRKMARPLDTMSFFAKIVVWIVIVNAIVIISLVTALTLKTREYEIGVLLSIGVSKIKVVLQLFLELILLAFLGFALASVSGSIMAGSVGEMVLDYQTSSEAQYETAEDSFGWTNSSDYFTLVSQDDLLSEYHVSVSPVLILEIFILGTGVVLIAIVIPSVMIMRLNPKQILLEQN